jgi:hypothetical protein
VQVIPPDEDSDAHSAHLYDQLTGPAQAETRFHAAALFTRYLLVLGRDDVELRPRVPAKARALVVWDAAVASVALAVKVRPKPLPSAGG